MDCLFWTENKLLVKHMPDITYVNVIWMLPSSDHNLYLCPNYMCVLIYMGIYPHVYT